MTGAGIVAIGGMMIRPRWVLPLLDLTAPTFLFRVRDAQSNMRGGRISLEWGRVTMIIITEGCSPARVTRIRVASRARRKRREVHSETPSTHGSEGR